MYGRNAIQSQGFNALSSLSDFPSPARALSIQGRSRYRGMLLRFSQSDPGGGVARKVRRKSKKLNFWCFRGVEMPMLARNDRNRSKLDKATAKPTQFDPRGSNGAGIFEICTYGAGYDVQKRPLAGYRPYLTFSTCMAPGSAPFKMSENSKILRAPAAAPPARDQKMRFLGPFN